LFALFEVLYFVCKSSKKQAKEGPMRDVVFRKTTDPQNQTKVVSIIQKKDEEQCATEVRKKFVYHVSPCDEVVSKIPAPQVNIRKFIDNKKGIEKFHMEIRGYFIMPHKRYFAKVHFHHTLHIVVNWKVKIFSPKKSAALT
jgi:hypothetical protein